MNLAQFGPALLAALFASLLCDWFFMDLLFGAQRRAAPELWRMPRSSAQRGLMRLALMGLNILTCAVYLFAAGFFGLTSLSPALMLAFSTWLAIAAPLIARQAIETRMAAPIALARAVGWLLKLLSCSLAAYYFL